jgi:hypothetical protein
MMIPLTKIVAVVMSLILALPQGFCCVTTLPERPADPVPMKNSSCCHQAPPKEQKSPPQAPREQKGKCCCTWDTSIPEKQDNTNDSQSLIEAAFIVDFVGSHVSTPSVTATVTPLLFGPRLHVLQCIWRC